MLDYLTENRRHIQTSAATTAAFDDGMSPKIHRYKNRETHTAQIWRRLSVLRKSCSEKNVLKFD